MSMVTSFSPLSRPSATVLVLGSMPGVRSLEAQQYYAHPRNHFWRIMGRIADFDATAPYEARVEVLTRSGIAVWDVLHRCVRPGSLDSSIQAGTRVPNDFSSFFKAHPGIGLVCFNGAEAEKSYNNFVRPDLGIKGIDYVRLPSTSPALTVPFEQKVAAWRSVTIGRYQ